jgi:NAD(P)-dependent dehydrogenase (short-subunit alcohol dehydrogenase family)
MSTDSSLLADLFGLSGSVAVVTGAGGAIGGAIARALSGAGATTVLVGRRREPLERVAHELSAGGAAALVAPGDVLDQARLEEIRSDVLARFGRIDVLINAAGGNVPEATLAAGASAFDLTASAFSEVVDLNLLGTLLPSLVFGQAIADHAPLGGSIVNISSMAATRAITRVAGYGAAKAAVESLTRWLAVEAARRHAGKLRVNAIAPGFFIGEQNRSLLLDESGELTQRGREIVAHTPMARFGEVAELASAALWLCGPGARFVSGVVVAVDGGFGAFSGV